MMFKRQKRQLLGNLLAAAGTLLFGTTACADNSDTLAAYAPVWTEALGEVSPQRYSGEELAAMVDAYWWTPERMRDASPVRLCTEDGAACTVATGQEDASGTPGQAAGSTAWADENPAGAVERRAPSWDAPPAPEVQPRDDLRHETLLPSFEYEVLAPATIRVTFNAGAPGCHGHRAVLVETDEAVAIAVVQGAIPGGPQVCPAIVQEGSFVLHTERPLQGRAIMALQAFDFDKK